MTEQTLVVVYAVGDAGVTGTLLGAATLVEPTFTLVEPTLNQTLADSPQPLRVGVFAAAAGVAEVIDVTRVLVAPDAPDLVLLELGVASNAPTTGVPYAPPDDPQDSSTNLGPTRAEIIAALRQLLAQAPPFAPPPSHVHTRSDPIPWFLHLFGNN